MSALITRLKIASENVDVATADLLREAIAAVEHATRRRRHRNLNAALAAAYRDANPVKRSAQGGKKRDSEDFWYFAPTPEVMREARRLLLAHDLLLKFTGQWITKESLVRVEYDLVFVPTGESQSLCWEAPPETVDSAVLGVTWTARHAQRCIHLLALGIPVEDDPDARKQHEERERAAALRRLQSTKAGEGMTEAFRRLGIPSDTSRIEARRRLVDEARPVDAPSDSCSGIQDEDVGGFAPPPSLPGDELDDVEYERVIGEVAASALRWQESTGQPWAELFKRSLGMTEIPRFLSKPDLHELQRFLTARGF